MHFKPRESSDYGNRPRRDTDLAKKRRENSNAKVRSKKELIAEHQKNGTLTKAIIAQIYKSK